MGDVCEHIKNYVHATGVYFVHQQKATRKSRDVDSIEENLFNNEVNALRFYATNKDHTFLLKEEHDMNSITGSLFEKKQEEVVAEDEEQEGGVKVKSKVRY